jgi:hypothetical protein
MRACHCLYAYRALSDQNAQLREVNRRLELQMTEMQASVEEATVRARHASGDIAQCLIGSPTT